MPLYVIPAPPSAFGLLLRGRPPHNGNGAETGKARCGEGDGRKRDHVLLMPFFCWIVPDLLPGRPEMPFSDLKSVQGLL